MGKKGNARAKTIRLTDQEIAQVYSLTDSGWNPNKIARHFGKTRRAVMYRLEHRKEWENANNRT